MRRRSLHTRLLLASLITLSACQSVPPSPENTREALQQALAEHRYRDALAIADTQSSAAPENEVFRQRRDSIINASREYREQTLTQARRLASDERWREAQGLLEATGGHLINPTPVVELRETLHQQEQQRLQQRLSLWWQAQARALLDSGALDTALDGYTLAEAHRVRQQREELRTGLARQLTDIGNAHAEQGEWSQAQRALSLVQRLQPEQPAPPALARAEQVLAQARQRTEQQQARQHQERSQTLMDAYRDSGSLEDLLAVREYLRTNSNTNLAALRDEVETLWRERYNREMAAGEALYARGEYQAAYGIWQSLLPLAPDSVELNKKLERTRRVLNNLRALEATTARE